MLFPHFESSRDRRVYFSILVLSLVFGLSHVLPPLMHPRFEAYVPDIARTVLPVGWRLHETVDLFAPLLLAAACWALLSALCDPSTPTQAGALLLMLSAVVLAQGKSRSL